MKPNLLAILVLIMAYFLIVGCQKKDGQGTAWKYAEPELYSDRHPTVRIEGDGKGSPGKGSNTRNK